MINRPLTREEHFKLLSIDFKGQAKLRRCDAAVHVEADQDQRFWDTIFHHFAPQRRLHFITHSRTWSGAQASGVTQALSFVPYLSKEFFICIDSDYRYLMQEKDINIKNFIFQTYTYSIENHYCSAEGLDFVCERATGQQNGIFNFGFFLQRYSAIVFELFLWHIYSRSNFHLQFERWEFQDLISIRHNGQYPDINNNGETELSILKQRVQHKLGYLNKDFPYADIESIRKRLNDIGVSTDNVYRFIRGHNLFDVVVSIGRKVCEKLLEHQKDQQNNDSHKINDLYANGHDFESHVKHNFSFGKYPEMIKIENDIYKFFGPAKPL
jgi:hypothetical protein